ncbi:Meckel syndrome type 1 protein [Plakobranchus ocellatus]|uniref:Meckel syndrome type 1 protein n=1 Tax=Plakobranchus ocellatus TaxID=259542 RepID=A0AAV4BNL4_9GAST|nr:Meckel syndrome type 1 protein [Plakobranchus ocellatus]
MAGYFEPDCGTAYYRSNDPIKNLKIKVTLRRVSASFADDTQDQAATSTESGVELATFGGRKKEKRDDVEECIIGWQQKIFCQREIEYYSQPENCQNVLDRKYNQDVTTLLKKRQNNMIFTYVDHDDFSHQQEGFSSMTNHLEGPSPLAAKMAQVRCRRIGGRQLREKDQGSIPKTLIIDEEPTEDSRQRSHLEAPPIQVMYIMADLSPADRPAEEYDEYVLCALKVDANGVLCVRPDFTCGRKPYSIETFWTREGFDYTIENVSKDMNRQEQDKELKMYREMYSRHNDFVHSCVGSEFELPPEDTLRYVVCGEILSAQDFEKDNLYIHMFTDLPKNWSADRNQQLSWITQSCAVKTVDETEIAYFSYPFHFELMYKKSQYSSGDEEPELPQFPRLMVEVAAFDSWSRHYTEGYTYFQLPAKPGLHTEKAHCWRPVGNSVFDNLRRFFTGGTPEIEDPTYIAVPSTFDGTYLSKFGFRTQSTGTVTARFNVMLQSRTFMETKANKRSLGSLLESLGITAMQANITSVLEAFKRARMKMVQAREAATQELLREARPIYKGELDD